MTPEAFRASTINAGGVSVDPDTMFNEFKSAWRSWQERRVRERIERELAELRARAATDSSPARDR